MADVSQLVITLPRKLAPVARPWRKDIVPTVIRAVTEDRGVLLGTGYHRVVLTLSDGARYGGHPLDQCGYPVYPVGWEPPPLTDWGLPI